MKTLVLRICRDTDTDVGAALFEGLTWLDLKKPGSVISNLYKNVFIVYYSTIDEQITSFYWTIFSFEQKNCSWNFDDDDDESLKVILWQSSYEVLN